MKGLGAPAIGSYAPHTFDPGVEHVQNLYASPASQCDPIDRESRELTRSLRAGAHSKRAAPFSAATLEECSASSGSHSCTETVLAEAAAIVWLESALHLNTPIFLSHWAPNPQDPVSSWLYVMPCASGHPDYRPRGHIPLI